MENKKVIIIYILKLFENLCDETLPVTQTTIAKVLTRLGIQCDRKTVGRNIRYLTQIGCPIKKHKSGGYHFDKKETWDLGVVNRTRVVNRRCLFKKNYLENKEI